MVCGRVAGGLLLGARAAGPFFGWGAEVAQQGMVGAVYGRVVEGGQVDAGGSFRLMAECVADGGEGDVPAACDAGPRVATDVGGEGDGQLELSADEVQVVVGAVAGLQVVLALVGVGPCDDGQEVGRVVGRGMSVEDVLRVFFPFHPEFLSGLFAPVGEDALPEVILAQEGHVDE